VTGQIARRNAACDFLRVGRLPAQLAREAPHHPLADNGGEHDQPDGHDRQHHERRVIDEARRVDGGLRGGAALFDEFVDELFELAGFH